MKDLYGIIRKVLIQAEKANNENASVQQRNDKLLSDLKTNIVHYSDLETIEHVLEHLKHLEECRDYLKNLDKKYPQYVNYSY